MLTQKCQLLFEKCLEKNFKQYHWLLPGEYITQFIANRTPWNHGLNIIESKHQW